VSWDANGRIEWSENSFGVLGTWYTADDCANRTPELDCTARNRAFTGPDGQMGWQTSENIVCTSGTAPKVALKADGTFAYAEQWGFLAGFTLNAGMPWNANERCVAGIQFDVSGFEPAILRINAVTLETQGIAHFAEVAIPQSVVLPWSAFAQGSWVPVRTPLDTTQLTSIEMHVFTNTGSPTPFGFCVSNVRFLYTDTVAP